MKKLILVVFIIGIVLVSGCKIETKNYSGSVKNSKSPNTSRPNDFSYCETDANCTVTFIKMNNCCFSCGTSVNIEGARYLDEWFNLNCIELRKKEGCKDLECYGVTDIKCINNSCSLKHEYT